MATPPRGAYPARGLERSSSYLGETLDHPRLGVLRRDLLGAFRAAGSANVRCETRRKNLGHPLHVVIGLAAHSLTAFGSDAIICWSLARAPDASDAASSACTRRPWISGSVRSRARCCIEAGAMPS